MALRREGMELAKHERSAKAKKRRRAKTFSATLMTNNMLRQLGLSGLGHFRVEKDADGYYLVSPFKWNHLHLCPDMGPAMMCMYGFLAYKLGLNVDFSFDLSHGAHNAAKATIKKVGLYRHEIVYCSAQNVTYGSALSPARLQQTREIVDEWFRTGDPNTDPWFQLHLPLLVKQMGLQVNLADESCAEVSTCSSLIVSRTNKTNIYIYMLICGFTA